MTVVHYILTLKNCSFLKVQSDGMIVGFEPHLRCDDKPEDRASNFDSSTSNPIVKKALSKNVKRIDSMALEIWLMRRFYLNPLMKA
jgi:hypothetical protein